MGCSSMDTSVNLVVLAGGQSWPGIQAIAHWNGPSGTRVQKVCVYQSTEDAAAQGVGQALARWVKRAFPEIRVDVREGPAEVGPVRRQLETWHRQAPTGSWVVIAGDGAFASNLACEGWIGRPGCRVVGRDGRGTWFELTGDKAEESEVQPLPELRREVTDSLSIDHLTSAWLAAIQGGETFQSAPAETLPMVRLTEAAIAHRWDWNAAFVAAGLDPVSDGVGSLLARYLAGLLLCLGAKNVVRRTGRTASGAEIAQVWVNRGGRLWVFDVGLDGRSPEDVDGVEGAGWKQILEQHRAWEAMGVEWIAVRPAVGPADPAGVWARGIDLRVLGESECRELPSQLAALLDVALSPDGAEVERCLSMHLAQTGRVRVFAAESEAVARQAACGADPAMVEVDGWLDRVRRDRRQNWLLWIHQGELRVRLPGGGRSTAASDWGLLLAGLSGVPVQDIQMKPAADDPRSLIFRIPDQPEARQRVTEWLQPFLNRAMTYEEGRERFAAKARVSQEASQATATPRSPTPAPVPTALGAVPAPREHPRQDRRRVSPPKPRMNPLADLDRALDEALGGET